MTTRESDDDRPTRVVLIRHAESNATVARTIGGPRTCSGLSPLGRAQTARLAERLAATGEVEASAVLSSGYPRAVETADALAAVWGLKTEVVSGFGEHDPGPECDGLRFDEFVARYGMPDWETDPHATSFPGGETVAEFRHRATSAFSHVVRTHPGTTIVIVCHGGVIDAVLRFALKLPTSGAFDLFTENTSLTELVLARPGRWRLMRYNDAAHLAGLAGEPNAPG